MTNPHQRLNLGVVLMCSFQSLSGRLQLPKNSTRLVTKGHKCFHSEQNMDTWPRLLWVHNIDSGTNHQETQQGKIVHAYKEPRWFKPIYTIVVLTFNIENE